MLIQHVKIPFAERRALNINEACDYSSLCRSVLYEQMRDGRIESTKVGKRRLVLRESLDKFLTPKTP